MTKKLLFLSLLICFLAYFSFSYENLIATPLFKQFDTYGFLITIIDKGEIILFKEQDGSPDKLKKEILKIDILKEADLAYKNFSGVLLKEIKNKDGDSDNMLLVNTNDGKIAYIKGIQKDLDNIEIIKHTGSSFKEISSDNDIFTIFMHYNSLGETDGSYLYNLTKGKIIHLYEIQKMHKSYIPKLIEDMPIISNDVSIAEIHSGKKGARCHLLINNYTGEVYWIEIDMDNSNKVYMRKEKINFIHYFGQATQDTSVYRFIIVPILKTYDSTWEAFLIDNATGKLAVFRNVHDYKNMEIKLIKENLFDYIDKSNNAIKGIPKIKKGDTKGIWIYRNSTEDLIYIDNIDNIRKLKIRKINIIL